MRISNIKIILFVKSFLALQMQVSWEAQVTPRRASSYLGYLSILKLESQFLEMSIKLIDKQKINTII